MKRYSLFLLLACSPLLGNLKAQSAPAVRNGDRVWLMLDLLVWKAYERRIAMTDGKSNVATTSNFTKKSYLHPNFDWDVGSRAAVGYILENSLWDVEFEALVFGTSLHQERDTGSPVVGMFPVWAQDSTVSSDFITSAQMEWKLRFIKANLDFARACHVGRFYYRPYFGLSTAWVNQHGHADYTGRTFSAGTDHNTRKLNYWGMGPRMGIEPRLYIAEGVSLYIDGAASYLYGLYHFREKETYLGAVRHERSLSPPKARWFLDATAGIQWKTLFMDERYALTFKTGWEFHYIPKLASFVHNVFHILPHTHSLWFQGGFFSGRFDF